MRHNPLGKHANRPLLRALKKSLLDDDYYVEFRKVFTECEENPRITHVEYGKLTKSIKKAHGLNDGFLYFRHWQAVILNRRRHAIVGEGTGATAIAALKEAEFQALLPKINIS